MADTCCELTWLLGLFKSFGLQSLTPVTLHCDSRSAIYIASNPVFHERTKHIDIDCHIVREKLQLGMIKLAHITTALQPADMFTKSLVYAHLSLFSCKLGVCNMFQISNLWEDVIEIQSTSSHTEQHEKKEYASAELAVS